MASRVRTLEVGLALCFILSFVLTSTGLAIVDHLRAHVGAERPSNSIRIHAGPAGPLSPTALDGQWLAYSNKSTCADRSGGDGVSAVRLSSSQIAWFFSDSYLGPAGPRTGFSKLSGFVHNLVVMQTTDGGHSTFVTLTGGRACAGPGQPGDAVSVVSAADAGGAEDQRYWAGDGLKVGARILRFYNRYRPGRVPYIPVGTVLASFAASDLIRDGRGPNYGAVIRPRITTVPDFTPPGGGTPIVWGAAVLRLGATVYIYGWQSPDPNSATRQSYLARVAASRLTDISAWRYYAGQGGWAAGQASAQPITTGSDPNVDTEFSVIKVAGRYWLIEHAGGLGSADIDAYPSPRPWGPFDTSAGVVLYHAPGIGLTAADSYSIMYSAQVEPALSSPSRLVISYNVNSLAVTAGCLPLSMFTNALIQPRFIAVPRAALVSTGHVTAVDTNATAGPPGYPPIVSKHPSQWFDAWAYRHGCPPVPAVRDVSATNAPGAVTVRWLAGGIGVRYRVYLRDPGSSQYAPLRTVRSPRVTLTHLTRGLSYQVLIVPENVDHRAGPGATVTVTMR